MVRVVPTQQQRRRRRRISLARADTHSRSFVRSLDYSQEGRGGERGQRHDRQRQRLSSLRRVVRCSRASWLSLYNQAPTHPCTQASTTSISSHQATGARNSSHSCARSQRLLLRHHNVFVSYIAHAAKRNPSISRCTLYLSFKRCRALSCLALAITSSSSPPCFPRHSCTNESPSHPAP